VYKITHLSNEEAPMSISHSAFSLFQEGTSSLSITKLDSVINTIKHYIPTLPSCTIGDLHVSKPIVQGGMGVGISLSGLASSVANQGGIGVIAANGIGLLEKDYYKDGQGANIRAFRSEIQKARSLSDGVLGVNIMVALADYLPLLDVAIEEKVDIIFLGAGLPIKNIPITKIRANNIKISPIVSSARAMKMVCSMWYKLYNDLPDCFVLEGPLAGGHLGFSEEQIEDSAFSLENLTIEAVAELASIHEQYNKKIALIVGGGVYSGADIHRFLSLGADGVQMGTRFVATEECDASRAFKEAYLKAKKEDIGLIQSPVGLLGRAIRNKFISDAEEGKRPSFVCGWKCLSSCKAQDAHYCISIALNNARKGFLNIGFVFAGTNAYRIKRIVSVAELMNQLEVGYTRAKASRITAILTTVDRLKGTYLEVQQHVGELALRYEVSLKQLVHGDRALKKQYLAATAKLEKIRLKLVETITAGGGLVTA